MAVGDLKENLSSVHRVQMLDACSKALNLLDAMVRTAEGDVLKGPPDAYLASCAYRDRAMDLGALYRVRRLVGEHQNSVLEDALEDALKERRD
jgi:hypothetical protein